MVWCVGGVDGVGGLVGLVCWCVGGVLIGGIAPLWFGVVGVGVLVSMYVCVAWDGCPHGGLLCWWCWWFGDWW